MSPSRSRSASTTAAPRFLLLAVNTVSEAPSVLATSAARSTASAAVADPSVPTRIFWNTAGDASGGSSEGAGDALALALRGRALHRMGLRPAAASAVGDGEPNRVRPAAGVGPRCSGIGCQPAHAGPGVGENVTVGIARRGPEGAGGATARSGEADNRRLIRRHPTTTTAAAAGNRGRCEGGDVEQVLLHAVTRVVRPVGVAGVDQRVADVG